MPTDRLPSRVLTDEEADTIRRRLAEGWRGPVLLTWLRQLLQDRESRRMSESARARRQKSADARRAGPGRAAESQEPCLPSRAGLIAKVFQADPLCRRCGEPLRVVAYVTDSLAIRHMLDHLGLSPPGEAASRDPRRRPRAGR